MAAIGCATATMKFFVSLVVGNKDANNGNPINGTSKIRNAIVGDHKIKPDRAKKDTSGLIWTQQPKGAH